jgi:hypothetical protein
LIDNGARHSRISVSKLVNVQEWEPVDYSINNDRSLATLSKPPFGLKMMVTSTFNNLKGSANYHLMIDFGQEYGCPTINLKTLNLNDVSVRLFGSFSIPGCYSGTTITLLVHQLMAFGPYFSTQKMKQIRI